MKALRVSLLVCATILAPAMAAAEKIPLNDLSKYLNGLKIAQAKFTQINSDGSLSTGTLYLRRPGRARFEYDPPNNALVIAGGGQVAIFDPKSNQPPEQYPLKKTPLNLILERNVNLGRSGMLVGHAEDGPTTIIAAQDPEHPDYGRIDLVFTGNPVELRKWIITDEAGTQTTVILNGLEELNSVSARLFNITYETELRVK
ncbi:MAG: LolA family protein [Brevirhabdus sp.]